MPLSQANIQFFLNNEKDLRELIKQNRDSQGARSFNRRDIKQDTQAKKQLVNLLKKQTVYDNLAKMHYEFFVTLDGKDVDALKEKYKKDGTPKTRGY